MSHQKHSDILLPKEGAREAAGHGVLLATMPGTSQALCEMISPAEKPGAQQESAVSAYLNKEANLFPFTVSAAL